LYFRLHRAHSVGQDSHLVFISEIFPNRHRAEGQTLGSFTHWIFAALLTTSFRRCICLPARLRFLVFCRHDGSPADLVRTQVPETKGVPLEQIQKQLGIE